MSKYKLILKELKNKELTTKQIAEKMGVDKKILLPYMSVLLNQKKEIIITNNKKPYVYTSVSPEAIKDMLYPMMTKKMISKKGEELTEIEIILLDWMIKKENEVNK